MTIVEMCITGLKVLAGIGTGLLVFTGLMKCTGKGKVENKNPSQQTTLDPVTPSGETRRDDNNEKILDNLVKAQNVCGKTSGIIQTLMSTVYCLIRLFDVNGKISPQQAMGGNDQNYNQGYALGNMYYGQQGGWGYPQPVNMGDGQYWNRISPFVVEVPPYSQQPQPQVAQQAQNYNNIYSTNI